MLQGRRTLGPWPLPAAAARKLRGPHPMQLCGLVFWQVSEQRVSTLANTSSQAQCCFTLLMKLKRGDPGCTVRESYIPGIWRPHEYEDRIQSIWTQLVFCYTVSIYWTRQYIVHSFIHPSIRSFLVCVFVCLSLFQIVIWISEGFRLLQSLQLWHYVGFCPLFDIMSPQKRFNISKYLRNRCF